MSWPKLLERREFILILFVVWALAYLPHLGTRTLRLEEGRRATPAREMLDSGDFVRPTLYGETYLNKPPLYFWIVAVVGSILGEVNAWAVRLPSVLGALGCALVALRFAPDVLDRKTRSLAALFVLSSSTLLDKGTLGEIESVLCLLVALSMKIWWDGNRPERQTLASWAAVGILLGLSGLLKGPAGPAIFYLTIGPYLVWTRKWRRLFSLGHFLCLAMALVPATLWAGALIDRGIISGSNLIELWRHQLALDKAAEVAVEPQNYWSSLVSHYTEFPIQVAGMFFPAVLWIPFALRRRWAESHSLPDDVRRFLICGTFGPFLAFYLYPESRGRHLMAAFFPAAMLAAVVVVGMARVPGRWTIRHHKVGRLLAWGPAVICAAGLVLAAIVYPAGWPAAAAGFVVGIAWTWGAVRLTRSTSPELGIITLAATLIGLPLSAWFMVNTVIVPWRAPYSSTQEAVKVGSQLPPGEVVYTTRIFPGKGEGYYNLQFHLAPDLRAAPDLDVLKKAAPCLAVVTPEERQELEKAGFITEEIGRMGGPRGPAEVHVIRLLPPH